MIKKTFYTVKEVADILNNPVSKVRYYVRKFKINVPLRAGKLSFTEKHIKKLQKINELVENEKYRLDGVAGNLRQTEEEEQQISELLQKLQNIKKTLHTLRSSR